MRHSKRAYGEWVFSPALKGARDTPRSTRIKNLVQLCADMGMRGDRLRDEVATNDAAIAMEIEAYSGRCVHFFFTGAGFASWLTQCSTPIARDMQTIVDRFMDHLGKGDNSESFMLHFEGGDSNVYLAKWCETVDGRSILMVRTKTSPFIFSFCPDAEDSARDNSDADTMDAQHTLGSAMAYMQAFPDTVMDGIPENLRNPNHSRHHTCRSVCMAEDIIIRDGPSPHYRVGHFRLLLSERFTKKRGQVVFVRGCFVKGKAETVKGV